jgi:hypothetical protein
VSPAFYTPTITLSIHRSPPIFFIVHTLCPIPRA